MTIFIFCIIICLIVAPIIGLVFILFSDSDVLQKKQLQLKRIQVDFFRDRLNQDISAKLENLSILKYEESITDAEYLVAKTMLLA